MERLIATHHRNGHQLDVIELVDDDATSIRLILDGQLLPPEVHPDAVPTDDEVDDLLARWDTGAGSTGVTPGEVIALLDALDEEHKAHATYTQVIADFGPVRPFENIVESEARHIAALTSLMHRYAVPVPANPWPGKVPRFETVAQACRAAVDAEIDNAALYDRLLAAAELADVRAVLENLQEASQERHLPAFRRCAERGEAGEHRGHHHQHHRGHD
jgi:hypothetical protein